MQSTNSQTGSSSYAVNAPKVIRKVKDKAYGGATFKSFGIAVIWVFVSLVILLPLAFFESWVIECFVIAVLMMWWAVYAKWFASGEKIEETFLFLKFFFDKYSGLHTIARYDTDVSFLEDVFPLVEIHTDGLIEFKDSTYGLLIKYSPERVNEEDVELHGMRMQEVIDGLTGGTSINFVSSSKHNMRKPILDKLLDTMNKKNTNPKLYAYNLSIYEMIKNKKKNTIDWDFYIFLGLGKFDSLQDAIDQADSEYPGLVDSLTDAGITTISKLTDRVQIAKEYRQMVFPVVI